MRRRQSDPAVRAGIAEHERLLLVLAVGVGDHDPAAKFRAHIADLEAGRPVVLRASDVGLPGDVGMVTLEADGVVPMLDGTTSL